MFGLGGGGGGGGGALGLAGHQGDFGPDDYERLLQLDDNAVKRGASRAELDSSTAVSTVPPAAKARRVEGGAAAAGGGGGSGEDNTCAVCLEEPAPGEMVRRLRCLHAFHLACIDTWLRSSRLCPVCKMTVGEEK